MPPEGGPILDNATVLSLFRELGGLQSSNQTILMELQKLNTRLDTQETRFVPREELLSRLREVRTSTVMAVLAFAMSALELWHWLTTK